MRKAERIWDLRSRMRSLSSAGAARLRQLSDADAGARNVAREVLVREVERHGGLEFFRESRPRAFAAHRRVQCDAGEVAIYPWGTEQAILDAATAILYEDEAESVGDRIRATLTHPVVELLGSESV